MKTLLIHSKKHGDFEVLYDDEDEDLVKQHTWSIMKISRMNLYYAKESKTNILFHRLILSITNKSILVDHVNHNGLDNRKTNLRICNESQNGGNSRPQIGKSSQYKGVSFHKRRNLWRANIKINKKKIYLGRYVSEKEAALAYNRAALEYFGDFAFLNDIIDDQ